ncbi:MAG: D-glycero-alpha-D-manno-heptose-7-phosphate kinase [Candidatus Omnitrophota bacterium]|jgi:D-glycero-alpha-D-manno-heptose-7-phosphate kinase
MIISRTPYRISFFGGGTDYPSYYKQYGGSVLSTSIDKYCYLHCRHLPPFFGIKHRVVWSHIETVASMSEILHPAVREALPYLKFDDSIGLEIQHQGDLPARSGMGSSSAFIVGLIQALSHLKGKDMSKHELALSAIELEQNILKESVGSQDQVATAYGGLNKIHFEPNGQINVTPLDISTTQINELEGKLMLFFSGTSQNSKYSAVETVKAIPDKTKQLKRMKEMVEEAEQILRYSSNLDDFGKLLHEAWLTKKSLTSAISTPEIDSMYDKAIQNGALGGKLLGAGGRGFLLLYVPEEKQALVKQALVPYVHVPFKFESTGSIVLYQNNEQSDYFKETLMSKQPKTRIDNARSRS